MRLTDNVYHRYLCYFLNEFNFTYSIITQQQQTNVIWLIYLLANIVVKFTGPTIKPQAIKSMACQLSKNWWLLTKKGWDKRKHQRMKEWMKRSKEGWVEGWEEGRKEGMNEWMDRRNERMDGWMDGWMDGSINFY